MRRAAAVGLVAAALVGCSDDEAGGCRALALADQVTSDGFHTYVVGADGSTRRFSEIDGLFEPSVTPDGRLVATTRADGDIETSGVLATTVLVLDAEGEEQAVVEGESGTEDRQPALSPDGDQLAFVRVSDNGGTFSLVVADVDGGEPTVLYHGPGERLLGTSWSPDGRLVAVARSPYGEPEVGELLVFDVASGDVVVEVPWGGQTVAWSWDSDTIVGFGEGGLHRVTVPDGEVTTTPLPADERRVDAVHRADGAVVILADAVLDGAGDGLRLDVLGRGGRTQGSVPVEAGLGVDRSTQPVDLASLTASRCFRPG